MGRCLLDTTALIDFSKGREPARSRILQLIAAGDELGVCPINIAEFYAGLPPEQHAIWDTFFADSYYWGMSNEAARRAGHYRYIFARQGRSLTIADAVITAVTWQVAAIVITNHHQ